MCIHYEVLDCFTLQDVVGCPGRLEFAGTAFHADLTEIVRGKQRMIEAGMRGSIVYEGDAPRGFAEQMPAEVAPPFDWAWAFFSAQAVDVFVHSGRELDAERTRGVTTRC